MVHGAIHRLRVSLKRDIEVIAVHIYSNFTRLRHVCQFNTRPKQSTTESPTTPSETYTVSEGAKVDMNTYTIVQDTY